MTTFTTPPAPPAPPAPDRVRPAPLTPRPGARSVGGGIAGLVVGILLLVAGLAMAGSGIALQALGDTWRRNGYVTPVSAQLASPSYAIATERLDMENPGQSWPDDLERLGSVRVSVTGTANRSVFIGIAPADQVADYLAGVRHATLVEIDDPATQYTEHPGVAPVRKPADETFWTTSAAGTGTQHLEWPQRTGTWMVVVMNADASATVDVRAEIGATLPLQDRATIGLLVGSVPVTVLGVLLLILGGYLLRQRPTTVRRWLRPGASPSPSQGAQEEQADAKAADRAAAAGTDPVGSVSTGHAASDDGPGARTLRSGALLVQKPTTADPRRRSS